MGEEVQDNFREDEADEYRTLKRELENSAKNCRVLQFKLKKTEKSLNDTQSDLGEAESKLKSLSGGSNALDSINKVRQLEKDLEGKNMQIARLDAELKTTKAAAGGTGPRKGGPGPCLSRTGSMERNVEDQLLKDLQDSIERENDLKEKLSIAEEDAGEARKKLSRLEDENESLSGQLKRMSTKKSGTRRSPSPYNRNSVAEKDEGISEDGEELSPGELKVQLEVAEQETGLLRKKVENLLTENLKITKEVKDLTNKVSEAKKSSSVGSYGRTGGTTQNSTDKKVAELQDEVNTFRVKLIEKDREVERLETQVKASKSNGKTLKRTGSQDEDLLKKLNVIEKEAEVLRKKTSELEAENDSLKSSKGGVGAAGGQIKLAKEKAALEEKVNGLETKIKEDEPVSDRQVAEAILALAKRQQESEQMLQSVFQELQEAKSMIDTLHNYDAPSPLSRKRSFDEYSSSSDSSPEYGPLAFSPEPKKMKTEFTYDNNLFNSDFPLALPNDNSCFYDMMCEQPAAPSCAQSFGSFPSQFDLNELLLDL